MDLMKEIKEHFEFLNRAKKEGMIDFKDKYGEGKVVQVYNADNFYKLSNDNEISIWENDNEISIWEDEDSDYPYRAEFIRDGIAFIVVLDKNEKEKLEALINGHQQNDG